MLIDENEPKNSENYLLENSQVIEIVRAIPNYWFSVSGKLCATSETRRKLSESIGDISFGTLLRVIGKDISDPTAGEGLSERQLTQCSRYFSYDSTSGKNNVCGILGQQGIHFPPEVPNIDTVSMGVHAPCGISLENAGRLTGEDLWPIKNLVCNALLMGYKGTIQFSSGYRLDAGRGRKFHNFHSCSFHNPFATPERVVVNFFEDLAPSLDLIISPESGGKWKNLEFLTKKIMFKGTGTGRAPVV